jgi:hypothetical protein
MPENNNIAFNNALTKFLSNMKLHAPAINNVGTNYGGAVDILTMINSSRPVLSEVNNILKDLKWKPDYSNRMSKGTDEDLLRETEIKNGMAGMQGILETTTSGANALFSTPHLSEKAKLADLLNKTSNIGRDSSNVTYLFSKQDSNRSADTQRSFYIRDEADPIEKRIAQHTGNFVRNFEDFLKTIKKDDSNPTIQADNLNQEKNVSLFGGLKSTYNYVRNKYNSGKNIVNIAKNIPTQVRLAGDTLYEIKNIGADLEKYATSSHLGTLISQASPSDNQTLNVPDNDISAAVISANSLIDNLKIGRAHV